MKPSSIPFAAICLAVLGTSARATTLLTLEQASRAAITHSPLVAIATAQVGVASGSLLAAGQWSNPVLSGDGDTDEQVFTATQRLALWGEPGKQWKAASLGLIRARDLAAFDRSRLLASVTREYFRAYADQQLLALAFTVAGIDARFARIALERFKAGDAPHLDVVEAQAQQSASQGSVLKARAAGQSSLAAIDVLMGEPPKTPWTLVEPTLGLWAIGRADASSSLPARAAQAAADQARAQVTAAWARTLPEPSLTLGMRRISEVPGGLVGAHDTLVHGGIDLPLPLWNLHQGDLAAAKANEQETRAQEQQILLEVQDQMDRGSSDLKAAAARFQLDDQRVKQGKELLEMAEESYRQGASNFVSVLEARRQWQAMQSDRLDALEAEGRAAADLMPLMPHQGAADQLR